MESYVTMKKTSPKGYSFSDELSSKQGENVSGEISG